MLCMKGSASGALLRLGVWGKRAGQENTLGFLRKLFSKGTAAPWASGALPAVIRDLVLGRLLSDAQGLSE